jgi:hypothetical protein
MRQHDLDSRPVSDRLRQHRYEPPEATLDRIKHRIGRSPDRPAQGSFWRSRLALVLTLVLGLGMSSGGAALAVTGVSLSTDASKAQYGPNCDKGKKKGNKQCNRTLGATASGGNNQVDVARASAQVGASNSGASLPVVSLAAIPLLGAGLAVLRAGFVFRRRTRLDS